MIEEVPTEAKGPCHRPTRRMRGRVCTGRSSFELDHVSRKPGVGLHDVDEVDVSGSPRSIEVRQLVGDLDHGRTPDDVVERNGTRSDNGGSGEFLDRLCKGCEWQGSYCQKGE